MTNPTHCTRCRAEFGLLTWKYCCFRCGSWFCAAHFLDLPVTEVQRRLGDHVELVPNGEGLCSRCDEQRVTTIRDAEREDFAEGDLVHLPASHSPDWLLIDKVFRVAAIVDDPVARICVLVPQDPWDTSMWLARGTPGDLTLVTPKEEPQVWARFEQAAAVARPELAGATGGEPGDFLQRFLRHHWSDAEVDSRLAWVGRLVAGVDAPQDPPRLAQLGLDLARSAGDVGVHASQQGTTGANASLVALAQISSVERDGDIARFRSRLREVARCGGLTEAKRRLDATAIELEAAGTSNDGDLGAVQSGLAILLRWLATGRKGLLTDSTEAPIPHPMAVAIGAMGLNRTTELDRALTALRSFRTEFPWAVLYERVRSALDAEGDWSRKPLGALPLEARLSQGTYKEVWSLRGRPDVVLAIAKPGQDAAVRDEVNVLRDLVAQVGRAGDLLGIQRLFEAGTVDVGGVKRVGFVTPRLSDAPKGSAWPNARRVVEAARAVGDALMDLHRLGYVHGDVKPANVLWDSEDRAVLVDYGGAVKLGPDASGPAVLHTEEFSAPEVLRDAIVTPSSDRFSWATTLQVWLASADDGPRRHDAAKHHRALWDVIDRCRADAPEQRPEWQACLEVLNRWLVIHHEPPSRLSSADSQVRVALTDFRQRWVQPLDQSANRLLGEALRSEHLPSHTGTRNEEEALSKQWLDLAKCVVNASLWAAWSRSAATSQTDDEAVASILEELTNAGSAEGKDACRQIRELIHRERESVTLTLSQSNYFLEARRYAALQDSLRTWRSQLADAPSLTDVAALLRRLGGLRNKLEHGARDEDNLPYGRAENGKVVLTPDDTAAIRADALSLLDAVLIKR